MNKDPYAAFAVIEEDSAPPASVRGGMAMRKPQGDSAGSAAPDPYAGIATLEPEGQAEGWSEWIKNSIGGRQDPAFADAASNPRVGQQYREQLSDPMFMGSLANSSDTALADIVQQHLGDRFIRREQDANGYEVFVTRGDDGKEQRNYLNKPGLDSQDVARTIFGALPYVATGGAAGIAARGAGRLAQAGAQGVAAMGTKVASDVAGQQIGSQQPVDYEQAALTGVVGAAAPYATAGAATLWRELVTIPGLVNRSTGQLTQKGIEAAQRAGLDPADFTPDIAKSFSREFARTGDEAAAAATSSIDRFGIRATRGQITKDKSALHQEEAMRWGNYGDSAKDAINAFDDAQRKAIRYGALGPDEAGARPMETFAPRQSIAERINPTRRPGANPYDRQPETLGQSARDGLVTARENARQADAALWDDSVTSLKAKPEALQILPDVINPRIAEVPIDAVNTPVAHGIRDQLTKFMRGEIGDNADTPFKSAPIQTVDQMRRRIGKSMEDAATGQDKAASRALYEGFNEWIDTAAKQQLLDGDAAGALQLAKARGFHREVMDLFKPKDANGKPSPAALRLEKILDGTRADSGEAVIDTLLGSAGAKSIPAGTIQSLNNFRNVLQRFAPDMAEQTWNDVRLAHWSRLVTNKGGETLGPAAIASNLRTAFQSQSSLLRTLYTGLEQRQMREYLRALETVAYRPPNASGSSYGTANLVRDFFTRLTSAFMGSRVAGTVAGAALDKLGVTQAASRAAATRILSPRGNPVPTMAAPALTGATDAARTLTPPDGRRRL